MHYGHLTSAEIDDLGFLEFLLLCDASKSEAEMVAKTRAAILVMARVR